MLIKKEIDIAVAYLTINKQRYSVADFCMPLFRDSCNFFVPYQNDDVNWFGYLKPLHMEAWMCVIVSILLPTPALYIAAKQCKDSAIMEFKLEKAFIFSLGALTFARR